MVKLFQVYYKSSQGPTQFHGVKVKIQSPQGSIQLSLQGNQADMDKQIEQLKQQLKESYSDTRRCEAMYANNIFDAFSSMGCTIQGQEEDKQNFLKSLEVGYQIKDLTKIFHDDCGAEIWSVALFKAFGFYYRIQCVRTWPGYQY